LVLVPPREPMKVTLMLLSLWFCPMTLCTCKYGLKWISYFAQRFYTKLKLFSVDKCSSLQCQTISVKVNQFYNIHPRRCR
jgi:hypothetical protein